MSYLAVTLPPPRGSQCNLREIMSVPRKLLEVYLSLVEEGIPVSLNLWTEPGNEKYHCFRLSRSNPREKVPIEKKSIVQKSEDLLGIPPDEQSAAPLKDDRPSSPRQHKTSPPTQTEIKPVFKNPVSRIRSELKKILRTHYNYYCSYKEQICYSTG